MDPTQEPPESRLAAENKAARKVGDRPHSLHILLTSIAILVSLGSAILAGLSLREAKRNREINEVTSPAFVKVSSLQLDVRTVYQHSMPQFKTAIGYITITNTGKAAAQRVRVEQALLSPNTPESPHTRIDGAIAPVLGLHELGPGASETSEVKVPLLVKDGKIDRRDPQITLDFEIAYNDGIHQGDKVETETFCAVIPEKRPSELLRFYYCIDQSFEIHDPKK
jgi:hypothetical protein